MYFKSVMWRSSLTLRCKGTVRPSLRMGKLGRGRLTLWLGEKRYSALMCIILQSQKGSSLEPSGVCGAKWPSTNRNSQWRHPTPRSTINKSVISLTYHRVSCTADTMSQVDSSSRIWLSWIAPTWTIWYLCFTREWRTGRVPPTNSTRTPADPTPSSQCTWSLRSRATDRMWRSMGNSPSSTWRGVRGWRSPNPRGRWSRRQETSTSPCSPWGRWSSAYRIRRIKPLTFLTETPNSPCCWWTRSGSCEVT